MDGGLRPLGPSLPLTPPWFCPRLQGVVSSSKCGPQRQAFLFLHSLCPKRAEASCAASAAHAFARNFRDLPRPDVRNLDGPVPDGRMSAKSFLGWLGRNFLAVIRAARGELSGCDSDGSGGTF